MTTEVAEEVGGLKNLVPTGTSVLIEGVLAETPEGTKQVCDGAPPPPPSLLACPCMSTHRLRCCMPAQAVELKASKVLHVGLCDAATYPIAKKKTSYEFLREKMHLRPRTNTIGAVARIRNALAYATHKFFQVFPQRV